MKRKGSAFVLALVLAALVCMPAMSALAADSEFHFRDIIFTGDTFTQLLGINSADVIAGYHGSGADAQHPNKGFTLILPKQFTPENFPNSVQTQVIGINKHGSTAGFYIDAAGATHGFLLIKGTFSTVDLPGTTFNQLLSLNDRTRPPDISRILTALNTPTSSTTTAECF
jgi:hypothetical protein